MASFGFRVGATLVSVILVALIAAPGFAANKALQFDGVNDYVTFGADITYLGLQTFTLEVWFYRTGTGLDDVDGIRGHHRRSAPHEGRHPGRCGDNRDINYFLGIRELLEPSRGRL